jgi:hypothetical protein
MPDISMCSGIACPRATTCYRFTAEPNPWRQSYFANSPVKTNGDCDHFMLDNRTPKEKNERTHDVQRVR